MEKTRGMDSDNAIICPKCGSKNIHVDKKGFSTGKAIAGGVLTGNLLVAAAAGGIGANKIRLTCLDCGHEFKIGEGAHEHKRDYTSRAEINEFEKRVIPKEEMPKLKYFVCECGKGFSSDKVNPYCPSCGRRMTEANIPTIKPKKSGCLGLLLIPLAIVLSLCWIL